MKPPQSLLRRAAWGFVILAAVSLLLGIVRPHDHGSSSCCDRHYSLKAKHDPCQTCQLLNQLSAVGVAAPVPQLSEPILFEQAFSPAGPHAVFIPVSSLPRAPPSFC
jgi:hypothetical protein